MEMHELKQVLKHYRKNLLKPQRGDAIETIVITLATYRLIHSLQEPAPKRKPPKRKKTKKKTSPHSSSNNVEGPITFTQIATKLGLNENEEEKTLEGATLEKHLNAFQSQFKLTLFSVQGNGRKPRALDIDVEVIRRIESIVTNHFSVSPINIDRPTIRIGCGLGLVPNFVPDNVARFRQQYDGPDFEVEIQSDLPQNLRDGASNGVYDLAITSFPDDSDDLPGHLHAKHLTMRLLVDRRSSKFGHEKKVSFTADELRDTLAGWIVAVPDPIRSPNLSFPITILPNSASFVRVARWFEALAMTLSSGSVVCAAFPQIFPNHQRSRFREFELVGSKFPKLLLGVFRPTASELNKSDEHRQVTRELAEFFAAEINQMSIEPKIRSITNHKRTAHVTRHRVGRDEELHKWAHGEITGWSVTPSGFVRATHHFTVPWRSDNENESHFEITGNLTEIRKTANKGPSPSSFITWNAEKPKSQPQAPISLDSYSVALSESASGMMIGSWVGRAVEADGVALDTGLFVLYEKEDPLTDAELNNLSKEFLAGLPHDLPLRIPTEVNEEDS